MSFRSTLWLGLLACTGACDGALMDAAYTAADLPPGAALTAQLEIAGDAEIEMVVRHDLVLRVRYLELDGSPRAGELVEFGLSGSAEGASLERASVRTNGDGVAETKLTAGSVVSSFQVRVSAAEAAPAYFDVRVFQAAKPTLTVNVVYEGQRKLEWRRFAVVGDMNCEQLLNRSAEAVRVAYVLSAAEQGIPYQESLVAGGRYAAFAWGSDDANSTLATGCQDFVAPTKASPDEAALTLTVKLENLSFTLAPTYDITLALDLSAPLANLAARTRSTVQAAFPQSKTPEASYLLDLLASNLDASARSSLGLDQALANLLTHGETGPVAYFEALSASVAEEGASSSLEGLLTPEGAPGFELTRMVTMRGGKAARELDLGALSAAPQLDARYDDDQAALHINALKIPLGFGRFARDMLDVAVDLDERHGGAASVRGGCSQLAQLVSQHASAFPGLTALEAQAKCGQAIAALLAQVRADWEALDDAGAALQLSGPAYVHDRDADRQAEDLGPSPLTGHWTGASEKTPVSATLRVTPKSTLTI